MTFYTEQLNTPHIVTAPNNIPQNDSPQLLLLRIGRVAGPIISSSGAIISASGYLLHSYPINFCGVGIAVAGCVMGISCAAAYSCYKNSRPQVTSV